MRGRAVAAGLRDPQAERNLKAATAASIVGVRDPWTALGLLRYGNSLWINQAKEAR